MIDYCLTSTDAYLCYIHAKNKFTNNKLFRTKN